MYALATTRVSILRGTSTNEFGDETDADTVHSSGTLANIRENRRSVFDASTGTPRVVRSIECRLPSDTDILDSDRIMDETDGKVYGIISVTNPGRPGKRADLELELEHTN